MNFPDVNKNAWYAKYIDEMSNIGIFIGDDQGNFRPKDALTRAEAAAVASRIIKHITEIINNDK